MIDAGATLEPSTQPLGMGLREGGERLRVAKHEQINTLSNKLNERTHSSRHQTHIPICIPFT